MLLKPPLFLQIYEEVGLLPSQLQLVCFGRPLPVDDGRRHFLVYPFLFQLTDDAAQIKLNWENEAYDWVTARWDRPPLLLLHLSRCADQATMSVTIVLIN